MNNEPYKSRRIIDNKPRDIIVNENGHIINRNPSKEELKGLKFFEIEFKGQKYSDGELLDCLRRFHEENGRSPTMKDFDGDPKYPSCGTYQSGLEDGILH